MSTNRPPALSFVSTVASPSDSSFPLLSPKQLHTAADPALSWLWDGYVAAGNMTLLTSLWKAGKTTLTAALLARMGNGGVLAGRTVQPGRAVVISEESARQWAGRCESLGIGEHVGFLCRPFRSLPRPEEWQSLLDHLLTIQQSAGLELIVIDPLAAILPPGANEPSVMQTALASLAPLMNAGVAVLILHHPRKQASTAGNWARGSGALTGFADILLEMHYYGTADADDRRRKLLGFSRHTATPRRQVIELTPSGTDWLSHGDIEEEAYTHNYRVLRTVLADAPDKWTRPEILAAWPAEEPAPSLRTLLRWLERAVEAGEVQRDQTGTRNDPHRYWLKGQEAKWKANDPLWEYNQEGEQVLRELRESMEKGSSRGTPGKKGGDSAKNY
jgi:hypothetical protein